MSSHKKRARELARRREQRYREQQAEKAARKRRLWSIAAAVTTVALIGAIVVAVIARPAGPSNAASPTGSTAATPTPTGTPPAAALAEGRTWNTVIHTSAGDIAMTLDGSAAPQAVASFVTLAQKGYFDGTSCHRLVVGASAKLLQCGDPTGTGTGGPGYSFGPIENAPTNGRYPAGTVAMARVGNDPNSMGSQFFLVYGDTVLPDDTAGGYTVFGTITSGLDVLQAVADAGTKDESQDGPPSTPVTIEGVEAQ